MQMLTGTGTDTALRRSGGQSRSAPSCCSEGNDSVSECTVNCCAEFLRLKLLRARVVIDRAHVRRRVRVLRELRHVETAEHQLEASVCHAGDAFQITVPRAVVVVDGAGIRAVLIRQIERAAVFPAVPAQREIADERMVEIRLTDRQRPVVFARIALVDEQGKSVPRVFGQRQRCPVTAWQTAQQIPVLAVIRPEQLRQIVRRLAGVQF